MVDWSKIKKEYISATSVPTGRTSQSPWDEIFADIPRGQALVLHEPEVNAGTVRQALQNRHNKGKFKYIYVTTKGVHGTATIYVTNSEKAEKPTSTPKMPPKTS
jgi:hypothetical protein